ncbi:UvrD-helicase domain-containing protein [Pilimelia columellifera]|uniref:DNA 3'-5' helicase n=1 Tax=Pilimelia columellifera subsp. columellifera TaxID=706583 RepID=A0ABP6B353_9ACTN
MMDDLEARRAIREQLDRTLFVAAGAGSGKTSALVDRVVHTVLAGTPLRHVAAVTFTEQAGAELRDRLRLAFEDHADKPAAHEALAEVDAAAIGTLHAFALRLLTAYPIEVGLPPLVDVRDEVASGVAFDARWESTRSALLEDPRVTDGLLLALAAGITLDNLRSLMRALNQNWDLVVDRLADPPALPVVDISPILATARRFADLADRCTAADDKLLARLELLRGHADTLSQAPTDADRLAALEPLVGLKFGRFGKAANWPGADLATLRADLAALTSDCAAYRTSIIDALLRLLAHRIGAEVVAAAQARRAEGRLEFHDLLVLARELLRHPTHGARVRAELQQTYHRLLLDEFQDTDPIQIELAVRIAAGAAADADDWAQIPVPEGRLFIVGDPKQSIYRFRRADIRTYLRAQQHIGTDLVLDTNFRTGAGVLAWVNAVFGTLIAPVPDAQPPYQALRAHRGEPPSGPVVATLGTAAHHDGPDATTVREREAADVAYTVHRALTDGWPVADGVGGWRPATASDIAVLIPTRTCLPQLEAALDGAGIAHHAAASSLVYRSSATRALLATARAIDDPSDALALVTALRSPLFGCGDDDLWAWRRAGGRWSILAPPPADIAEDQPVAAALRYLRRLHYRRSWLAPSELLTTLITDRRMLETAADSDTAIEQWRQLRIVTDAARAWADVTHGGLRDYLAWAARQSSDSARVAEALLPETDAATVRIMTVHAAKGLEFPIVIVAGLSSRPGGARRGVEVLWQPDGGWHISLGRGLATADFDLAKPVDEEMDHHERIRLLYVACTRARDHLVVSQHRCARRSPAEPGKLTNAELISEACADLHPQTIAAPTQEPLTGERPAPPVDRPEPYEQWLEGQQDLSARLRRPVAIRASSLEGKAGTMVRAAVDLAEQPVDPGLAKDARDLELPPWNKGRYGTAIGRAAHGVLQTVDLATGADLPAVVAAQCLAEGVPGAGELVTQLARAALASPVVQRAAAGPHWRETYVGARLGAQILEGIIDLVYRDDDGQLVLVDYKTDATPVAALDRRTEYYRPQIAAYVAALADATGEPVDRAILLFLHPDVAIARTVPALAQAVVDVRRHAPALAALP